jgi:hypothetical protein
MKNKQKYTPVRFSHLTSYAGIGSIVRDANDMLMVVTDTRYWTDKLNNNTAQLIPNVCRVKKALGIDQKLMMPPKAKQLENGEIEGNYLPAVLFPTYAVCKKCGLLHNNPWQQQHKYPSNTVTCKQCESELEQLTWCAVSSTGHLDNVPWHTICHQSSSENCKVDYENAYLRLSSDSNGKKIIICTRCNSRNKYERLKTPNKINEKRWLQLNRVQPWIWNESVKLEENDSIEILEVNNPGVYLPERVNCLVIPPESRISKSSVIYQLITNSNLYREVENIENIKSTLRKKSKIKTISTKLKCTSEALIDAIKKIKNEKDCKFLDDIDSDNLLADEYKAFLEPIEDIRDDEDFVTEHKTTQWHNLQNELTGDLKIIAKSVKHLIVAKRLREIQIFKGFYRVEQGDKDKLVPPDIVGESDWLPAIELFGEGVFFTINEEILSRWENIPEVRARAEEIAIRYEQSEIVRHQDIIISPRFLLLHTLSHLLIRELEITVGYPAASLKERIYCSCDKKMSGILIYTVVADIVGSLGGIIESADPKAFLSMLEGAIKHAQWCSLDPVCTEHEGQGPGWLNRAACHACALVPEPSCDYNNVFLDRVFIKGSEELGLPSIISFVEKFYSEQK